MCAGVAVAAGGLAPTASASVVTTTVSGSVYEDTWNGEGCARYAACDQRVAEVRFAAGAGEPNRVSIHRAGQVLVVADSGAPLTAGSGCSAAGDGTVRCELGNVPDYSLEVELGDGGDTAEIAARAYVHAGPGDDDVVLRSGGHADGGLGGDALRADADPAIGVTLLGGAGDDVVLGDVGPDELVGGAGNDSVSGGAGNDTLREDVPDAGPGSADADRYDGGPGRDSVSYGSATAPVAIDLSNDSATGEPGEHDGLVGIEDAIGGAGADVLVGDDADNLLAGAGGDDRGRGGAGDDVLRDIADAEGDDGNDRISLAERAIGGAGNDRFFAVPRVDGGEGDDKLFSPVRAACGSGRDLVTRPRRVSIDCEDIRLPGEGNRAAHLLIGSHPTTLTLEDRCDRVRAGCRGRVDLRAEGRKLAAGRDRAGHTKLLRTRLRLTRAGVRWLDGRTARPASLTYRFHDGRSGREAGRSRITLEPPPQTTSRAVSYAAVGSPNQVVSASASPRSVPSPTQAT